MLKQTLALIIALSAPDSLLAAQSETARHDLGADNADTVPAPAEQICRSPLIVDQVPLAPVAGSDLMTVPVGINGTTKQFLLDIGFKKPTSVSPELMAKLSLPELDKNIGGIPSTAAAQSASTSPGNFGAGLDALNGHPIYNAGTGLGSWALDTSVRVSSLIVGSATDRHMHLEVAPKGAIGQSAPYAGFLTGDFFRHYDVELDFSGRKITWLTPTNCSDPNQVAFWPHDDLAIIPVTVAKDGRWQMRASIRGHLINAEIDTSSPQTVMRRDIAEQDVGLSADGQGMTPFGDLKDGMGLQVYVSTFPKIVFAGGGVTAENVPVLIQDYSMIPALDRETHLLGSLTQGERIPDLVVGMDVLRHFHMFVVPGQGRIYVTSPAPK